MADDKIYGLTKRAAQRTAEVTKRVLGKLPRAPGQSRRVFDESGLTLVGFQIVSADNCGTCTATATVAIDCGTTPELDSYDQFTVYDMQGCHLNEPVEALEGRFGWATYGRRMVEGACPGLPEYGWWIVYLCGLEDSCQ